MQSALVASWELSPVSLVESPMLGDGDRVTFLKKKQCIYHTFIYKYAYIYTYDLCVYFCLSLSLFFYLELSV